MTEAHIASVRGTHPSARQGQQSSTSERMSELLRRYPNIADPDRLDLAEFLKNGHPEELAKATYGAGLEARVIAFKKDHPEQFRSSWLPWIAILTGLMLILYFAF